jgi:hypothetical protein
MLDPDPGDPDQDPRPQNRHLLILFSVNSIVIKFKNIGTNFFGNQISLAGHFAAKYLDLDPEPHQNGPDPQH